MRRGKSILSVNQSCFLVPVFLTVFFVGCYEAPKERPANPESPVRTKTVVAEHAQLYYYTTGRTEVEPVNIVPRIRGTVEEISFESGIIVNEGDVLFKIEQFDYQNKVDQAKSKLDIAIANQAVNKSEYDRQLTLEQRGAGFTTQADIDRAKANYDDATAQIQLAQAVLAEANKQLERTIIKAPVRGKISRNLIEKGNMVDGTGPSAPILATIMPMDPMYVYFEVTDRQFNSFLRIVHKAIEEKMGRKIDPSLPSDNVTLVELARKNGLSGMMTLNMRLLGDDIDPANRFPIQGIIDYDNNQIDRNTGTNTIRGVISNPQYTVFPGNLCEIQLADEEIPNAIIIEESAIGNDLSEKFIWVIDAKMEAVKRPITQGSRLEDGRRVITSGLTAGEKYVTEGGQKLRAGVKVKEM